MAAFRDLRRRVEEVFSAALDCTPTDRAAFLDRECGSDQTLRAEVESLLLHDEHAAPDFLTPPEPPAGTRPLILDAGTDPLVGQNVAGYQIQRVIAAGGMGTVYEAVQDQPRRTVALKVMHQYVASYSALRRFQLEAEVLGRLRHPNIAQIYQAGMHQMSGVRVPFFAMEYVAAARPITQYADEQGLDTRSRLSLFAKVCDAVHHGHQKGIIHRDLKPANILVDADGEPKVIDFGVARATDTDIAPTTQGTGVGQIIGTMQYMSPEQCDGDPHEIDTRSDVYSLGVVLHELLTGALPYEATDSTIYAATRAIKEQAPRRLSAINRKLRGDIETIVLKALEKYQEKRYGSAANLAQDIRRYLNREPIEAKRDNAWYVLRKSVRRYKLPIASAASFVLLISTATVALSIMYANQSRARQAEAEQRRLAEANQDRAQQEAQKARTEAAKSQQATRFIQQMLSGVDPEVAGGLDTKLMRMILDDAAARIETELVGQPEVEASIRATIGSTYQAIGEYPLAQAHLEQALEIRKRVLGEEHPDTLGSMNDLAVLYHEQGRYTDAEALLLRALEIDERVLGQEHADTLKTMNNLGSLYYEQGRYAEAEPLYVRALEINERVLGAEHPDTLKTINNLGLLYCDQGRYAEAERLLARALEIRQRVLGAEHPDTLKTMNNLGLLYLDQARYAEAEPLLVQVLEIRQRVLGEEHPHTLLSMNNLAPLYQRQGRYDEAEPLYVRALEVNKRLLGEEHPATLGSMNNLASLYHGQARYAEAEPLRVRVLEICKRVLGEEHPNTLISMNNLASLYGAQGHHDQAEPLLFRALQIRKRVLGEEHPATLKTMLNLGSLYLDQGRYAEAEPLLVRALQIRKRVLGEGHPDTLISMNKLGDLYTAMGRLEEAEALLAVAVGGGRRSLRAGHPTIGEFLTDHGACLTRLERYDEAETALLEAHQTLTAALGPAHKTTIKSVRFLMALYDAWDKPDLAAQWQAKLDATAQTAPSEDKRGSEQP